MEIKDIKIGGIYVLDFSENHLSIFRCSDRNITNIRYDIEIDTKFKQVSKRNGSWGFEERIRPTTQDECMWFEYCELHEKYFSFEEYQKNSLLEFIKEENILSK